MVGAYELMELPEELSLFVSLGAGAGGASRCCGGGGCCCWGSRGVSRFGNWIDSDRNDPRDSNPDGSTGEVGERLRERRASAGLWKDWRFGVSGVKSRDVLLFDSGDTMRFSGTCLCRREGALWNAV